METPLVHVISLGCPKNRVETERAIAALGCAAFALTADLEQARLVLVNTCSFLHEAREEGLDTLTNKGDTQKHHQEPYSYHVEAGQGAEDGRRPNHNESAAKPQRDHHKSRQKREIERYST